MLSYNRGRLLHECRRLLYKHGRLLYECRM